MRIWVSVVAATALAAGVVGACTSEAGGDVGAPCAVDTDCSGDLICDEHQGAGSCQEPHGHGEDTEGDSEGETEHEDTEHDHDSGSETGHHDTDDDHADSSSGGTGGTGAATTTGDPTTGGAVDDECAMYCDCMQTTCSQYDAYPFVDRAGCMDYCGGQTDDTVACFTDFCGDAVTEPSPALAEHWCEHAWGELGTNKC